MKQFVQGSSSLDDGMSDNYHLFYPILKSKLEKWKPPQKVTYQDFKQI